MGVNDGQTDKPDIVAVLNTISSRSPIATMLPAEI